VTDLGTRYLGLSLANPLIVTSCGPLSDEIGKIRRIEDSGAGAVVLYSLFEEQLRLETQELHHHLTASTDSFSEAASFFPEAAEYRLGPEEYLDHIRRAKEAVRIPVIASLNGSSVGGWTSFAKQMEQAGADALELNVYSIATDLDRTGSQVEEETVEIVKSVSRAIRIPFAVKLSPFWSSIPNMARRIVDAGADGLVLFNRFYQPDIDVDELEVRPTIALSTSIAMRVPMRWIAILHGRLRADLAASCGIHGPVDVVKMMMAGATVAGLCSVLLTRGIEYLRYFETGLRSWMEEHEYASIDQLRGCMSQIRCPDPAAFERAQYMRAITSFEPPPRGGDQRGTP
jgi:dihydroorotate dehydrogenase (fumarate)